ncbi:hornerin-like [Iris pallida]|uniref:Hornerin-like n=1 Tax=Iris pallida TaxID=29817 RepID=A0AAX6HIJ1_IRIPA|nr:hornerin-like [Iris pallida]
MSHITTNTLLCQPCPDPYCPCPCLHPVLYNNTNSRVQIGHRNWKEIEKRPKYTEKGNPDPNLDPCRHFPTTASMARAADQVRTVRLAERSTASRCISGARARSPSSALAANTPRRPSHDYVFRRPHRSQAPAFLEPWTSRGRASRSSASAGHLGPLAITTFA